MKQESWSGEFVDPNDPVAIKAWARGMCEGVDLKTVASQLGTEPTISAVAESIAGDLPESTREVAKLSCIAELKKTSKR